MKRLSSVLVPVLACVGLAFSGVAKAQPPANIAGTTWTVQINRDVATLTIDTQGGPGAPGAAICRTIRGSFGVAPVRGLYCPATGRIHLLHNNLGSNDTVRAFTGNVSEQAPDEPLFMAGTVMIEISAFGNLGEYNFSAVQAL